MTRYLPAILLAIASLQATTANPLNVREDVPEVIPGEGLPSLAELNVTSAELYAEPLPKIPEDEMSVMFTPRCGPSEAAYGPVAGVVACHNYLNRLGTKACKVPANRKVIEFCKSGGSHAIGQGVGSSAEQSYCRDVARGLLWVLDNCTRNSKKDVAGFNAAYGNGDLIVGGTKQSW